MSVPFIHVQTIYYLKKWGRWQRWLLTQGLGYPSENVISKLIAGKGSLIGATHDKLSPSDPVVSLIEQTVEELAKNHPSEVELLYYHYQKSKSLRYQAKARGMSYSAYREKLYRISGKIQQVLQQTGLIK